MWEVPSGLPGAADHELVLVFADDAGVESVDRRRGDTATLRAGCRCGWRGERVRPLPRSVSATDERTGNTATLEARIEALRPSLRAQWWREHLTAVWPALELAAAMPAARLADPALADAVASAWVDGASWAEIGAAVGITRQVAHRRWRTTVTTSERGRAMLPAADGRPRRRVLPEPGGWPGQPGWSHPAPEHAAVHEPLAWGVSLSGRETVGITTAAAYAGPGCSCGWRGGSVAVPDLPRTQLRAALDDLSRRVFAPAWNAHLHQALPTLRIRALLGPARITPAELTDLVSDARRRGATWAQIGDAVGMTTQGAWDRWHRHDPTGTRGRTGARTPRRTSVLRSQARA